MKILINPTLYEEQLNMIHYIHLVLENIIIKKILEETEKKSQFQKDLKKLTLIFLNNLLMLINHNLHKLKKNL